jgi:hypothetical protein
MVTGMGTGKRLIDRLIRQRNFKPVIDAEDILSQIAITTEKVDCGKLAIGLGRFIFNATGQKKEKAK